jgi:hypothetical protein
MFNSFALIFVVGILVFLAVSIFLLCFTRSYIELPLSIGLDSDFEDWCFDSEESVAGLSEDARLSYERARGNIWSVILSFRMVDLTML